MWTPCQGHIEKRPIEKREPQTRGSSFLAPRRGAREGRLAFGTYRYEIIELGKNGEELARTKKIEFKISVPVYDGGKNTVVI